MLVTLVMILAQLLAPFSSASSEVAGVAPGSGSRASAMLVLEPIAPEWCIARAARVVGPDGKQSISLNKQNGVANLIASRELVDQRVDSLAFAQSQGKLLKKEFAGYRELSFQPAAALGQDEAYVRDFTWKPGDGAQPVRQLQGYFAQNGVAYVVTVTTAAADFQASRRANWSMLQSVSIGARANSNGGEGEVVTGPLCPDPSSAPQTFA
ncbi:MAG: DcrB-related protein [Gaiellales bacterium]